MCNYRVIKDYGRLDVTDKAEKRLRTVSWNGAPAHLEVRTWILTPEGEKPGSGVILSEKAACILLVALNNYFVENATKR